MHRFRAPLGKKVFVGVLQRAHRASLPRSDLAQVPLSVRSPDNVQRWVDKVFNLMRGACVSVDSYDFAAAARRELERPRALHDAVVEVEAFGA